MKQSRQENIIYLATWGLLFAAPLLAMYIRTSGNDGHTFDWTEVMLVWRKFAVYLLLFLIHNFLLAPLLVHRRKRAAYFAAVAAMLVLFGIYQCSRPDHGPHGPKPAMERLGHHQPPMDEPPMAFGEERPPLPSDMHAPRNDHRVDTPPPFVGERDIVAFVTLLLLLGANLGIKNYFRSRHDRKRLAELEHENLQQQLEYLRYQVNPHFFMNTLNNIHALVDIDPELAKDTIVELSKMMRFVLYEGNKPSVPLSRECDFISHYVALMQLRYTDQVTITLHLPQEPPNRQIPPLLLITFIENAFKHGISYQHPSFIQVEVSVQGDMLRFSCCNSKADKPSTEKGGVGLANVRKRLDLLYGNGYTLDIRNDADTYSIELNIPLS